MADEKSAVARPTCSILDTNVLVSATASPRALHGTAQSVVRWPAFGRQICVSGQILREYLVVATRPLESNGLGLAPTDAVANVSAFRAVMRCLDENDDVQERLAELPAPDHPWRRAFKPSAAEQAAA